MPDPAPPAARHLHIVADLELEVGDDRGRTTARLTNEQGDLVLDVDEPTVLLRAVPGRGLARDLPISVPTGLIDGTSVLLRSRGRDLGRVQLGANGRLRLRPTLPGLVVAGRTAVSYGSGRVGAARAGAALLAALVVAAVAVVARRSRR